MWWLWLYAAIPYFVYHGCQAIARRRVALSPEREAVGWVAVALGASVIVAALCAGALLVWATVVVNLHRARGGVPPA